MTTHPYWPLTPNSTIEYQVFKIKGRAHLDTLHLDVTERIPSPVNAVQRKTMLTVPALYAPATAIAYAMPGQPLPTPATLRWENGIQFVLPWIPPNGFAYIGEYNSQIAPEPLLAFDTQIGVKRTGLTHAVNFADGKVYPQELPWTYMDISRGPWDQHPDTIRTGLLEQPANGPRVIFNYIYRQGIGLVDEWYGALDDAGNVTDGYQRYATSWSGQ